MLIVNVHFDCITFAILLCVIQIIPTLDTNSIILRLVNIVCAEIILTTYNNVTFGTPEQDLAKQVSFKTFIIILLPK